VSTHTDILPDHMLLLLLLLPISGQALGAVQPQPCAEHQ
jgi:hypothetical protein